MFRRLFSKNTPDIVKLIITIMDTSPVPETRTTKREIIIKNQYEHFNDQPFLASLIYTMLHNRTIVHTERSRFKFNKDVVYCCNSGNMLCTIHVFEPNKTELLLYTEQ